MTPTTPPRPLVVGDWISENGTDLPFVRKVARLMPSEAFLFDGKCEVEAWVIPISVIHLTPAPRRSGWSRVEGPAPPQPLPAGPGVGDVDEAQR